MAGAWANRVQSQCRRRGLAGWRRSAKPPFLAAGSSLERRARRRVGLSGDAGGDRGDRGDRPAARGRATVSEAPCPHVARVAPLSGWKTGSRGPRRQLYATAAGSVIHTLRLGGKNSSCARQRFALNRLRLAVRYFRPRASTSVMSAAGSRSRSMVRRSGLGLSAQFPATLVPTAGVV